MLFTAGHDSLRTTVFHLRTVPVYIQPHRLLGKRLLHLLHPDARSRPGEALAKDSSALPSKARPQLWILGQLPQSIGKLNRRSALHQNASPAGKYLSRAAAARADDRETRCQRFDVNHAKGFLPDGGRAEYIRLAKKIRQRSAAAIRTESN